MTEINSSDVTLAKDLEILDEKDSYTITGTGMFDKLMEAVNVHIDHQYDTGRLEGTAYAEVYLGGLQSSMQQGIAFLLARQKADQEAELLKIQVQNAILTGFKIQAETLNIEQDTLVKEAQERNIDKDTDLKAEQIELTIAQTKNTEQDTQLKGEQTRNIEQDTQLKGAQTRNVEADTLLKGKQEDKIDEEILYIIQKTVTELAQTDDATANGGVIGAQVHLYGEQAKGFYWNAAHAQAKTVLDTYSMQMNVEGEQVAETLDDLKINEALAMYPEEGSGVVGGPSGP